MANLDVAKDFFAARLGPKWHLTEEKDFEGSLKALHVSIKKEFQIDPDDRIETNTLNYIVYITSLLDPKKPRVRDHVVIPFVTTYTDPELTIEVCRFASNSTRTLLNTVEDYVEYLNSFEGVEEPYEEKAPPPENVLIVGEEKIGAEDYSQIVVVDAHQSSTEDPIVVTPGNAAKVLAIHTRYLREGKNKPLPSHYQMPGDSPILFTVAGKLYSCRKEEGTLKVVRELMSPPTPETPTEEIVDQNESP